ncbi:MAG: hypothetical protein M1549_00060 [Candidatus Dependentiae bacterium]|nr:hypothetical protein [Candidatus Dependentiae bacterium]
MNRKDLEFLESEQIYPSVSIFVRTHRAMPEREKDPIAVKNMISEAKERLLKEFSAREVKELFDNLDSIAQAIDYAVSADGLAIFVNRQVKQVFTLPLPLKNRVVIDSRFVVRDIFGELQRIPRYWLLSLSEKPTRLFYGSGDDLTEIIEPENDILGISRDGFPLDYTKPKIEEFGFQQGLSRGGNGQEGTAGRDSHLDAKYLDDHMKTFFKKVDHLLTRFTTPEPLPLLVAGVEKNIALFEMVTANEIAAKVLGDFSNRSAQDLAAAAQPALHEHLTAARQEKLGAFEEAVNKGKFAFGLHGVWHMAVDGRIHELFVEEGYHAHGEANPQNPENIVIYDKEVDKPELHDDLVNLIINMVIAKGGGRVVMCKKGELKEYGPIAAILRY